MEAIAAEEALEIICIIVCLKGRERESRMVGCGRGGGVGWHFGGSWLGTLNDDDDDTLTFLFFVQRKLIIIFLKYFF